MTNEELVSLIREGKDEYITDLWNQLLGFTNQQVYRFYIRTQQSCTGAGITTDDLIQEAYIALTAVIQGYDVDKGKVITYYGTALKKRFLRVSGTEKATPLNNCVSVDTPLDSETPDNGTIADVISSPEAEEEFSAVIDRCYIEALRDDIEKVMESLTVTGRNIIRCCFWENMTFTDIERAYNIPMKDIMKEYRAAMKTLHNRYNMTILNKYKDDITNNYYSPSFSSWRETGTSSTEREAMNNIKNETIKLMNAIIMNYNYTPDS